MKKINTLIAVSLITLSSGLFAQCASFGGPYDLTVSNLTVLSPAASMYNSGIVCPGGHLIDSTVCCTRFIHIDSGAVYEAGPLAYGFVYLKNHGTFDGHGSTMPFTLFYETGATILNFAGGMTVCPTVTFPNPSPCTIPLGVIGGKRVEDISIYPNPVSEIIYIDLNFSPTKTLFSVYEVTGKIVMESNLSKSVSNEVSVSSLPTGIYSYRISENEENVSVGKFVVRR